MASFIVKPPEPSRPSRAGAILAGGFKPIVSKAYTRPFLAARFLTKFGRVQTHSQQGFHPPSTTGRLTDVCRFRAARLSAPVNY
jgi:hypothetical protein